ncbi:hypothetical protein [Vreelandella massiliensis]|uniref:hypothetical protein n=1 Tax=Vreelandella massiliensis TaxID=1816686 RepID=UPI00096ABF43|nr:hypothetical protein [Halomonas massiliensis]
MPNLNVPVVLANPTAWPEADGQDLRLVDLPDPKQKFALVQYVAATGAIERRLLMRADIRKRDTPPPTQPLASPPLRWGAIVTLRDGNKVICTHPSLGFSHSWKGLPVGGRSMREYDFSQIADIEHINSILSEAA